MRRAAVETGLLPVLDLEAELRRDDDLIAHRRQRFADDSSFVKGPYTSAVSKKVTPPSNRRPDDGQAVFALAAGPYPKLMPMQPKPSADTSSPLVPNIRFCIPLSFVAVSA